MSRWGTNAPWLQAAQTTITFLSSQPDLTTDPIIVRPTLGQNQGFGSFRSILTLACQLPAAIAGVLASQTTKARASNQLWRFSAAAGSLNTVNEILVNDTTHPSWFWTYARAGGVITISQPILTSVDWGFTALPVEVDAVAAGDAVLRYDGGLLNVNVVDLNPTRQYCSTNELCQIEVKNCNIAVAGSQVGDEILTLGSDVWLHDSRSEKTLVYNGDVAHNGNGSWSNVDAKGGVSGGLPYNDLDFGSTVGFYGGIIGVGANSHTHLQGAFLTADVILGETTESTQIVAQGYNSIDSVYLTAPLTVRQGTLNASSSTLGGPFVWGTGALDAGRGQVMLPVGAGKGAAEFLTSGGLKVAGLAVCCLNNPAAATTTSLCNLACASGANLDTSLGATVTGCLYAGGGMFCNTGL